MSLHDVNTGTMHLVSLARAFQMTSEEIRTEFRGYPKLREQATRAAAVQRHLEAACGEYRAKGYQEVEKHLEAVVVNPFFYTQGLLRKEFMGFLNAVDGVLKALQEGQEDAVVWSYLGVMYTELTHSIPQYYATFPGKYGV